MSGASSGPFDAVVADGDAEPCGHVVQFYERDPYLIGSLTRFVAVGLGAGEAAIVIATAAHREALEDGLCARGLDVAAARDEGRYVALDACETLARFMVDGSPDATRFTEVVGGVVAAAAASGGERRRVRAFGEMVALLWGDGNPEAAIRLEELWNELGARLPLSLLCAYPMGTFDAETHGTSFARICGQHARVIPAESYTVLHSPEERLRAVTRLQQKATALENEAVERRLAEKALQRTLESERVARAEAEAACRAKDEFLAMLSHELRNPLAAVRNAIVTARLDVPRRERALEIAGRQADHLARLVDDLLDVARVTRGRITLKKRRVSLAGIVERAVETARPLLDECGHAITVALPRHEVQLDGDATRLEQVVLNLVTNAAKYTDPGGRIDVVAERLGPEIAVRVRDNGIGIAPHVLPHVFDLFTQADRTLDRTQGGLGIGLTVVRHLVELHGGRVEARSAGLGSGAEFVVYLPALQDVEDTRVPSAAITPRGAARVLLVEDNVDAAESLLLLLEVLGHRVLVVHDGAKALEVAESNPSDVMLIDIGLPGINGYEIARRIRRHPQLKDVVLIALTGYGREEDRRAALTAGFDHHLVKPVDPGALQRLVARLGTDESEVEQPRSAPPDSATTSHDASAKMPTLQ